MEVSVCLSNKKPSRLNTNAASPIRLASKSLLLMSLHSFWGKNKFRWKLRLMASEYHHLLRRRFTRTTRIVGKLSESHSSTKVFMWGKVSASSCLLLNRIGVSELAFTTQQTSTEGRFNYQSSWIAALKLRGEDAPSCVEFQTGSPKQRLLTSHLNQLLFTETKAFFKKFHHFLNGRRECFRIVVHCFAPPC